MKKTPQKVNYTKGRGGSTQGAGGGGRGGGRNGNVSIALKTSTHLSALNFLSLPTQTVEIVVIKKLHLIDRLIYLDRIAEKQVHAYQGHVPVCACVRAFLNERKRERKVEGERCMNLCERC